VKSDFLIALTQLAAERGLPKEMVLDAIEAALASAYKKDNLAAEQNISVRLNPASGDIRVFVLMDVVQEVEDDKTELDLKSALKLNSGAKIGDVIEIESAHNLAGRIAAQTAKQVVMQRLREAERELVFAEYADRAEDVTTGTIQRLEQRQIIVDLGRTEGILPEREQVPTERYRQGQKLKLYIVEVAMTAKGPEIIVSRSDKNLVKRLFEIEVPEIHNGIVEMKAIAREPGSRSKVAVVATQEGVDAVGSCVGLRGIRIQNVVNELQGEKIDVVQWHSDPSTFISNALNPSQVLHVSLSEEGNNATVVVQDKQLSLAIGREGQNARLAAKLTGWKIDILSSADVELERLKKSPPKTASADAATDESQASDTAISEMTPASEEKVDLELVDKTQVLEEIHEDSSQASDVDQGDSVQTEETSTADTEASETIEIEEEWIEQDDKELEEEVEEIPLTDDIWKVPQLASKVGGSQIRFAEDIMVPRANEGRRRGKSSVKRKKGSRGGAFTR
jgi:N utilization substance protein A